MSERGSSEKRSSGDARRGTAGRWASVLAVGLAGAVWLPGCGDGEEQATRPAAKPAAGRVDRVLKYAPPNCTGVVHGDLDALRTYTFEQLRRHRGQLPKLDIDALEEMWARIRSQDVFLIGGGGDVVPSALGVMHGSVGAADIDRYARLLQMPVPAKMKAAGNGRYDWEVADDPWRVIVGAEADDLPDDLLLLGPAHEVTGPLVKGLGAPVSERLRRLLAAVDVSAPIWCALELPGGFGGEGDIFVVGSVDPRPNGKTSVAITFPSTQRAQELEGNLAREDFPLHGLFQVRRVGAKLTLTHQKPEGLAGDLIAALVRARRLARRAMSAANLRRIGIAIAMYMAEEGDRSPESLLGLVKRGTIHAEHFFSPSSGRKPRIGKDGRPVPPFDYVYLAPKKPLPGDALVAYERPEINNNEGTHILTFGYSVRWVTMAEFRKQLARTQELMKGSGE